MQVRGPVLIGNYSFSQNDILGKGVTGNVYKGTRLSDNYPVAIKAINLKLNQNQVTRSLLQTELKSLKLIKPHPNIIKFLDVLQDQNFCFIITELYPGGTLKQLLEKQGTLTTQVAFQVFRKIVAGYCSISDSFIIHRDLKPANIMFKQGSLEPVIIDFGFAEIVQTKTVMRAFNVGSPAYMAPQAFTKTLYSEKSDVWSLGVILYEMLTGQTLDESIETKDYFNLLSQGFMSEKILRLPQIFKEILSQVLRINPFERISVHRIKYILDKHTIMKLNNTLKSNYHNFNIPMKSLRQSIQISPSIVALKSQPLLMNKSNTFDQKSNKLGKSVYQSGHFELCNSLHKKINQSSNLTIQKQNNLTAKLVQSRYRTNLVSPSLFTQINQKPKQEMFIQRINKVKIMNPVTQNPCSLHFSTHLLQSVQTPLQINNQRQFEPIRRETFKPIENQIQYFPMQPSQKNNIKLRQQIAYLNDKNEIMKIRQPYENNYLGKQNMEKTLSFRENLQLNKRRIKQERCGNQHKFSFKKMSDYQQNMKSEYLSVNEYQQGLGSNINRRAVCNQIRHCQESNRLDFNIKSKRNLQQVSFPIRYLK